MTRQIEVLDALPGCGKTHSVFTYMAENQEKPWLYLTPTLKEITQRVPLESARTFMEFFYPDEESGTKSEQVFKALKNKENIACSHALMLRFQDYHIQEIIKNEYNVVCDEELNLISNFDISKSDISFLVTHGLLEFGEQDGKVTFTDKEMSIDAKYGKVKQLADMGCLFAAKRKQNMLVTQISPRLIEASNRFILLTYQYDKSIMQTFMSMHGYSHKELVLPLRYPPATIRKNLQELIEFIETPSIKKVRSKYSMSKSWWDITSTDKDRDAVVKAIRSAIKASGVPVSDVFYTLPKNRIEGGNKEKVNTSYIKKSNFLACSVRSTCEYNYKQLGVHAYTLYPHQSVKAYMQDMEFVCNDDVYAINMLLQWLFRGCIRDSKPMKLAILSSKMNTLFKDWLMEVDL